jgi:hypothetical protein
MQSTYFSEGHTEHHLIWATYLATKQVLTNVKSLKSYQVSLLITVV